MATTTMSTATTSSTMTSTSSAASPTGTHTSDSNSQKPLLFFVALGFGVVFTNLWIIVGVKYCFRYNRRARQGLIENENENTDQIGLGNVPRPRRRREKKLMTMEEVNERFPLTKYKLWRSTREQEGLPAAGGIDTTPSRAASIKEAALERSSTEHDKSLTDERPESAKIDNPEASALESEQQPDKVDTKDFALSAPEAPDTSHSSSDVAAGTSSSTKEDVKAMPVQTPVADVKTTDGTSICEKTGGKDDALEDPQVTEVIPTPVDDEEDDPIRTALPAELITSPGDTCAICLDTLDDDDDVRGLTCGHAFHAGCLDPWLTGRRACCPLCKADYYVPKPRPEGENANNSDGARGQDGVAVPRPIWPTGRAVNVLRPRMVLSGTRYHADARDRYGFPVWRPILDSRRNNSNGERRPTAVSMATTTSETTQPERRGFRARYMDTLLRVPRTGASESHFRAMRRRDSEMTNNNERSAAVNEEASGNDTTPRQLEAGTR